MTPGKHCMCPETSSQLVWRRAAGGGAVQQMRRVLHYLLRQLQAKQLATQLTGLEVWTRYLHSVKSLGGGLWGTFRHLTVHSYTHLELDYPGGTEWEARVTMRSFAAAHEKKVWVSECGPLHYNMSAEMDVMLTLARHIIIDLNVVGHPCHKNSKRCIPFICV